MQIAERAYDEMIELFAAEALLEKSCSFSLRPQLRSEPVTFSNAGSWTS